MFTQGDDMERIKNISTDLLVSSEVIKIFMGTLILFAGAQIRIPLNPVPITLSTVAVMLIGLLYKRSTAIASVIAYLAVGASGTPVFNGFSYGLKVLQGPTAGYLLGFLLAVIVMTSLRQRYNLESFLGRLINCAAGTGIIYICGITWLSTLTSFNNAITLGFIPFIIPGAIKAIFLCGAMKLIYPNSHRG